MVPHHVEHGEYKKADLATAYLRSCEGLMGTITNPGKRAAEPDPEPFKDPAALLPKKGPDAPDSK